MTEEQQKCILIIGMMRTGTSTLAGILKILGVKFCKKLIDGDTHNPKGYFESISISDINSEIFNILDENVLYNRSFNEFLILEKNWWLETVFSSVREEALQLIKNEFKGEETFCFKEPQMSILFPFWIDILKELHIEPYIIIPVRNPLETAFSLSRRNKWSPERCLFSWLIHMIQAEYNTRNYPRVFIHFDELTGEPEKTINLISEVLNIEFPKHYNEVKDLIDDYVDSSLKHQNILPDKTEKFLQPFIYDYYKLLLNITNGKELSEDIISQFDLSRNNFYNMYDEENSYINHLINYKKHITEIYRKSLACYMENKIIWNMMEETKKKLIAKEKELQEIYDKGVRML